MEASLRPGSSEVFLYTLGRLELRARDGVDIRSVLRQPKRTGLLLYLALTEPAGFRRRDELLALFWPEMDAPRARHALSQAAHVLRKELGTGLLDTRGDEELSIRPNFLWTDARSFREAVRRGDLTEALALYRGDLVPAFHIDDAPEFDVWVEGTRSRLREEAARAAWSLAEQCSRAGDNASAFHWSDRVLELAPTDELVTQRVAALRERLGDRPGAVRTLERLARLLDETYELELSPESAGQLERLRASTGPERNPHPVTLDARVDERVQEVLVASKSPAADTVVPSLEAVSPPLSRRKLWRLQVAAGVAAAAILTAGWIYTTTVAPARPESSRLPLDRVAVLYFEDQSPKRDLAHIAEGLTSTLIEQLSGVPKLKVISLNGVRPFRDSPVPVDSIARRLATGVLVGGSVTRSGEKLQISVELIDGADGSVLQHTRVERSNTDLLALLDDVSREVAEFLRRRMGRELRLQELRDGTTSPDAWELVQRSELLRSEDRRRREQGDFAGSAKLAEAADALLLQAHEADVEWPAPLVLRGQLALTRVFRSMNSGAASPPTLIDSARSLANRALAISPTSAAALELRGEVETLRAAFTLSGLPDSTLRAAERDLRAALYNDPGRPRAASMLSTLLFMTGSWSESRAFAEQAYNADGYLEDMENILVRLHSASFELDDDVAAHAWCREIQTRYPGRQQAVLCALLNAAFLGDRVDLASAHAIYAASRHAAPQPLARLQPSRDFMLASALARAGMRDSARVMLNTGRSRNMPRQLSFMPEAAALVLLGEYDEATLVLGLTIDETPFFRGIIAHGRAFRPMHGYPPFQRLVGIPAE